MHGPASAHDGRPAGRASTTRGGPDVCNGRSNMSQGNPPHDDAASSQARNRYAGFHAEDDFVLYDRENETAWIASDTALGLEESV